MRPPELTPRQVAALVAITGVFCSGVGITVGAVIRDHAQPPLGVSAIAPFRSQAPAPVAATRNGGSDPTASPSQHAPVNAGAEVAMTGPTVQPSVPRL
ncbi:MAG: hypothetical protein JWP76_1985 [Dactylosporangium sp.]|jgi:hypothetical protein|nr:hypothetical protein [Dactylosporangium sp.]